MSALGLLAPLAVAGGVNTLPEPSGSQTVEMGTVFVPFLELVSHLKYAAFTHHISAHSPGDSRSKKFACSPIFAPILSLVAASRSL